MEDTCVILDTNILMVPESQGVDIFSELDRILDKKYKLIVPETIVEELKNIKKRGESSSERKAARIGLELSSRAEKVPSKKKGDEEIMRLARGKNCAVATNDSRLRKNLRKEDIPTIYLRQKSHLTLEGKI
ncbi:hypothetical protein AKJ55_00965 [candidate division MSBL1 archaeon SCGC-AAA382M17]|uniref:PIN domain-containing protein n=1 Tax=candidate division MSBL1 archaeon SCGC-AAA382M17 TaxID=1698284 RepID=A0ABR5TJM0_9EURY|nr:hypothetical protein AKJ55_00965 [candidate division MSBL1 archaeon SCGC-AAA382M17]